MKWETPSQRVYEDDKYVAFLDINPINFGHTLVIPREHYANVEETPDEVLAEMMKLTKKLGPAIQKAMAADAYNVGINNGAAAGQAIDHIHFHIIPRFKDDGFRAWQGRERYGEGEMGATAKRIKE
ncbi:MAG: HIT family protein [Candidatus Doudnabacteria bacterium]|nr:HIT family protein [Candidatus Doudnabacteria bacterium]